MNLGCFKDMSADKERKHILYAACSGQCKGDVHKHHRIFSGNLFDKHECKLCKQKTGCVLMHVCKELRPHATCTEMCGDCIVRAMQTNEHSRIAFRPQRHSTPVVTALLGMTLLQEIENIVCAVDANCSIPGRWTWSFQFEKRLYYKEQAADTDEPAASGANPAPPAPASPVHNNAVPGNSNSLLGESVYVNFPEFDGWYNGVVVEQKAVKQKYDCKFSDGTLVALSNAQVLLGITDYQTQQEDEEGDEESEDADYSPESSDAGSSEEYDSTISSDRSQDVSDEESKKITKPSKHAQKPRAPEADRSNVSGSAAQVHGEDASVQEDTTSKYHDFDLLLTVHCDKKCIFYVIGEHALHTQIVLDLLCTLTHCGIT